MLGKPVGAVSATSSCTLGEAVPLTGVNGAAQPMVSKYPIMCQARGSSDRRTEDAG